MKIGITKEIKSKEGRVALLPPHVETLVQRGHEVFVGEGAGTQCDIKDSSYQHVGAVVLSNEEVYNNATLILKVKEILPEEFSLLRQEHIILTNIHAAADKEQLDKLLEVKLTAISLENTHEYGSPNCPLAGEVGALEGVRLSLASHGGTGRHFMSHYGEPASTALVLGLGQVGRGALRTLLGLGVNVIGLDINKRAIQQACLDYHQFSFSADSVANIKNYLYDVDMIFNCVMWPKHKTDHIIYKSDLEKLRPGCVIVDISCDTNGAVESCKTTTWENPTYTENGVLHFCVDNLPGAVPITASAGNGVANLQKVIDIAEKGVVNAVKDDAFLARGLTCHNGELILEEAGIVQARDYMPIDEWLKKN